MVPDFDEENIDPNHRVFDQLRKHKESMKLHKDMTQQQQKWAANPSENPGYWMSIDDLLLAQSQMVTKMKQSESASKHTIL